MHSFLHVSLAVNSLSEKGLLIKKSGENRKSVCLIPSESAAPVIAFGREMHIGRDVDLRAQAPYITSPLYYDRNVASYIKQPWTEEVANDPNLAGTIDFPSLSIENNTNNFQTSSFFLRNGDFLRLRSLEIGYNFPKNWIKKARLEAANIYLRGMNLFTLDHLDGLDPEVLEGYPVMRSYNIGVNLTF